MRIIEARIFRLEERNATEADKKIVKKPVPKCEQVRSDKFNLFDCFLDWSSQNAKISEKDSDAEKDRKYDRQLDQLLQLLKRLIFKLVVCIENFNYLFESNIEGRDVFLQKVVAEIKKLLKHDGTPSFQPFPLEQERVGRQDELEEENIYIDPYKVQEQLDHNRNGNIVRDFKLRKIIMSQIEKMNSQNLVLPIADREDLVARMKEL